MKYTYSGPGRLIGRRAEYAMVASPAEADWRVEDRPQYIGGDGLPASATFVWDAISDNLVTVAKAGATSSDPHGGIVKQIVHGGFSYDDPIETVTVDPLAPAQLSYLYAVYDEVGAGHLEAVLNRQGELVARNVTTDPYGHGSLDLAGPAVDRISLEAQKSESGDLTSVTITIGATEDIAAASVAAGTRLAAIGSTGAVLRLAPVAAELDASDAASAHWTLTGEEWTTFIAEATSISIAATSQLRGSAWSASARHRGGNPHCEVQLHQAERRHSVLESSNDAAGLSRVSAELHRCPRSRT